MKPTLLTRQQYRAAMDAWPEYYLEQRWVYLSAVAEVMDAIPYRSLLEVGAYRLPIDSAAVCMDLRQYVAGGVVHDADRRPWPWPDNSFDLVASSQTIEHLRDREGYFRECRRLARWAVVCYPYRWTSGTACHQGLDETVMDGWAGRAATERRQVGCRMIHVYDWSSDGTPA